MIRVLLWATMCASVMSLKLALPQGSEKESDCPIQRDKSCSGYYVKTLSSATTSPACASACEQLFKSWSASAKRSVDICCSFNSATKQCVGFEGKTMDDQERMNGFLAFLCLSRVEAREDPHMCNIHRQHFDLNAVGEHLLLQVPKGSPTLAAVFQVNASIVNVGGPCHAWIDGLTISGAPFGLSPLSFHTRQGSFNTDDSIFAQTDSVKHSLKEIASRFASSGGPIQVKLHSTGNLMQPTQDFQRVELRTLQITLQPSRVQFAVTWATSLIAGKAINYLDFASSGLHVYPDALIGGLLGDDPHAAVQVNCEKPALFSASPPNMARFGSRASADK